MLLVSDLVFLRQIQAKVVDIVGDVWELSNVKKFTPAYMCRTLRISSTTGGFGLRASAENDFFSEFLLTYCERP